MKKTILFLFSLFLSVTTAWADGKFYQFAPTTSIQDGHEYIFTIQDGDGGPNQFVLLLGKDSRSLVPWTYEVQHNLTPYVFDVTAINDGFYCLQGSGYYLYSNYFEGKATDTPSESYYKILINAIDASNSLFYICRPTNNPGMSNEDIPYLVYKKDDMVGNVNGSKRATNKNYLINQFAPAAPYTEPMSLAGITASYSDNVGASNYYPYAWTIYEAIEMEPAHMSYYVNNHLIAQDEGANFTLPTPTADFLAAVPACQKMIGWTDGTKNYAFNEMYLSTSGANIRMDAIIVPNVTTFDGNDHGTPASPSIQQTSFSMPNCTADDGYEFLGWSLNSYDILPQMLAGDAYQPQIEQMFYAIYRPTHTTIWVPIEEDILTKGSNWELNSCLLVAKGGMPTIPECYAFGFSDASISAVGVDMLPYMHGGVIVNPPANTVLSYGSSSTIYSTSTYRYFIYTSNGTKRYLHDTQFSTNDDDGLQTPPTWDATSNSYSFSKNSTDPYGGSSTSYVYAKLDNPRVVLSKEIYKSGGQSLPATNQLTSHVAIRDTWDGSIKARASAFNVYVPIYDVAYIDFNWNGGEEVKYSGLTPESHPHDKGIGYVTYLPSARKEGYYFIGWQDNNGNNYAAGARYPTAGYITGDDATLTAMFRPVEMDYAPATISELALGNKVALVIEDGNGGSNRYAIKMNDKVVTMIPVTTIDALPEECWFTIGYKSNNDVLSFRSNLGYNLRCPEGVNPLTLIGSKEAQNFDTLWHTELSTAESKAYKLYSSLINNYGHRLQFKDGTWYISATNSDDKDQYVLGTSLANTNNAAVWKIYKQTVSYPTQDHYVKASYDEELTTIDGKRQIVLVNNGNPVSSLSNLTCSAADLQMEDGMIVNPETQYIEQVEAGTANLSNYSGSTIGVTGALWTAGAAAPGQLGWQDDQAYLTTNDQYAAIQGNGTLQQSNTKSLFHVYSRAYKVTFDASSATEHGTRIVDVRYVLHGSEIALDDFPEIEAQDGRRVVGWSIVKGNGISLTKGQVITSDTTFYAVYCNESQAIVDYDLQGRAELIERHFGNDTYTLPTPTKVKKQWTFVGWYDAPEDGTKIGDAGGNYTPTGDITLYAHYVPNYTVTLRNGLTVLAQISIAEGTTYTFPNISAYPSATTLDSDKPNFRGWIKQPKAGEQATMAGMRAAGEQTQVISGDSVYQAVWGFTQWTRMKKGFDDQIIEGHEYVLGYCYAENSIYTIKDANNGSRIGVTTNTTTHKGDILETPFTESTAIYVPTYISSTDKWVFSAKGTSLSLGNSGSSFKYVSTDLTSTAQQFSIILLTNDFYSIQNTNNYIPYNYSETAFSGKTSEDAKTAYLYHNNTKLLALPYCDVHFFVDDEEVEEFQQTVAAGTGGTLPTPEDKPGYGFRGWFDEEGNRVGDAGEQYIPTTAPYNLIAKYGRHTTITLKNGLDEVHTYSVLCDDSFTFPSATALDISTPNPTYPNLIGWAETDQVGVQYEMDNLIPDQSTIIITDRRVTYQAIWGYNQWEKITETTDLVDGEQYVLGVYTNSKMYTVQYATSGAAPTVASTSADGDIITQLGTNTAIVVAEETAPDATTFYLDYMAKGGKRLYGSGTSYFYWNTTNGADSYYQWQAKSDATYGIILYGGYTNYYYPYYNSGSVSRSGSASAKTLHLYRKHLEVVAFSQCQVHLEAGDGTLESTDILCTADRPNAMPQPTPNAADQAFKGWYDAPQNGHLVCAAGETYVPTQPSITLYAQYGTKVIVSLYNEGTKIDDFPVAVGMPFFFPTATNLKDQYPTTFQKPDNKYPDFYGWAITGTIGEQNSFDGLIADGGTSEPITSNTSFQAIWGTTQWKKITATEELVDGEQYVLGVYTNSTMYTVQYKETSGAAPTVASTSADGDIITQLGTNTAIVMAEQIDGTFFYLDYQEKGGKRLYGYSSTSFFWNTNNGTDSYYKWKAESNATYGIVLYGGSSSNFYPYYTSNKINRTSTASASTLHIYSKYIPLIAFTKSTIHYIVGDEETTQQVTAGQSTTLITPSKTENFLGWYTQPKNGDKVGDVGDPITPTTGHVFLYAQYEKVQLILNETTTTMTDIAAAAAETSVEVHMTRHLLSDSYNTFCVPFSMTADEVAETFGGELYKASTVSDEDGITTIYFEETDAIVAGKPYLIKPEEDITDEIVLEDKTITTTPQTVDLGTFEFRGVFVQTEIEATNNLILSTGDLLYRLIRDGNIKGMRAYFHQKTSSSAPIRYMIGRPHGITTNWEEVNGENQLIKFIHNGQLLIRKNGKIYNALGAEVKE